MKRTLQVLMAVMLVCMVSTGVFAEIKTSWGGSERLRHEYWKNNRDMNDDYYDGGDRNWYRVKTSLWGQAEYEIFNVYAKLTNEFKGYNLLGSSNRKVYYNNHQHWDPDEVIFDNLYLDINNPKDIPWTFRIGRQDLINQFGENFLICDGTPGDGSRTFYFNAVRATWKLDEVNTFDILYINNPRDDIWLPVINEDKSPIALNTTAEDGYVFYLRNKAIENLQFEPYFIYKRENDDWGSGYQARESKIKTPGFFAKYTMDPLAFRMQLAEQLGSYGDQDRQAWGGYFFVDKACKEKAWKPTYSAGFVYLSGDNKKTESKLEAWNPLFTRFPLFSELYAQAYQYESGNSYWTNLTMYRICMGLTPSEKLKLSTSYSFLRANALIAPNTTVSLSGKGKNRGHLLIGKADYAFSKNVTGYLLGEYFIPSDGSKGFYADSADPGIFVRTQLEFKF